MVVAGTAGWRLWCKGPCCPSCTQGCRGGGGNCGACYSYLLPWSLLVAPITVCVVGLQPLSDVRRAVSPVWQHTPSKRRCAATAHPRGWWLGLLCCPCRPLLPWLSSFAEVVTRYLTTLVSAGDQPGSHKHYKAATASPTPPAPLASTAPSLSSSSQPSQTLCTLMNYSHL